MKLGRFTYSPGIFGIVAILLVTLKLAGVLCWPWYVVTFPLYAPIALYLLWLLVMQVAIWYYNRHKNYNK